MSSVKQTKVRKCSICFEADHNKRTCPQLSNYNSSLLPKKSAPKQQMFVMEKQVIDLVNKIMEKGFFSSKAEFYRHCIINEIAQWINLKELLQEED